MALAMAADGTSPIYAGNTLVSEGTSPLLLPAGFVADSIMLFSHYGLVSNIDNITYTQILEPASLSLLGLGTLVMLRRRR